ncbi:MAG TPA: hypothetical protein VLV15_05950 [Dongiaceae bacterium]|nr:hypothetical protein [Dongiaceae bacterium]
MAVSFALLSGAAGRAGASLVMGSGLGTTHVGNLVTNGSFETGAPPVGLANEVYWATGTALAPFSAPPAWTTSGGSSSYASWGNDGTGVIRGSDTIADGQAALYFGNGAPVLSSQQPTFNANGTVSFASPPTFTTFFSPVPVILLQSINRRRRRRPPTTSRSGSRARER